MKSFHSSSLSNFSFIFDTRKKKKKKEKEKRKENKEGKFNNIYTESMEDSPIVGGYKVSLINRGPESRND